MKKTKLLPLLLALPMLASCGIKKPSQPKFAKVSDADKISGAKFVEGVEKETLDLDFLGSKALPSSEMKLDTKYSLKRELLRGKKNYRGEEDARNATVVSKLDAKNNLVEYDYREKSNYVFTKAGVESKSGDDTKYTDVYQEAKVDGKKYFVVVDKAGKEFTKSAKIEGDVTVAKAADAVAKEKAIDISDGVHGYNLGNLVSSYSSAVASDDKAEMKKYSFWKKDKVFTIEYKSEDKDVEVKQAEKVVAKRTIIESYKAQIDFTKGKVKSLVWSTFEMTYKVLKNHSGFDYVGSFVYAKDDVDTYKWVAAETTTYEHKDVKLKALDISNFTKIGETW